MSRWDQLIQGAAQRYNVDPQLIAALVQVESSGDPKAYNASTGATGLGQQIPATAKALGIDPTDPAQSIEGVAKLLDENLRRYGNPEQAILAYHGGTDQSNWGPKTQDYLRKITNQYGAPAVARNEPAVPSGFEARFGPRPTSANNQAASTNDAASAFVARFGERPAAAEQPLTTQQPVMAQPAPQEQPNSGIVDMALGGLEALGKQGISNVNAVGRGISDALDAPAEWLAYGAEKSGLTGALANAGIPMPTYDQQVELNRAGRAAYDAANPDAGIQGVASRTAGNLAGVLTPLAAGEAALVQGGRALSGALGNPHALNTAGAFLRGQGGLASRVGYNAAQGAAGGALLSGGQPDTSLGESAALGAALGGAVPIAGAAIRGGVNGARALIDPFTEAGQTRVAQNILQRSAGNGPLAADLATYVPGSTPTLAQATGNPTLAAIERQSINRAPNEFGSIKEANNQARAQFLDGIRGNAQTLEAAIAARETQALPLLEASMANAKPANVDPVVKVIDDILESPQGQRDAVVNSLSRVRDKLGGGTKPEIDPQQLYGIRKSINDQLEVVAGRDNSASQLAAKELIQVRDALDQQLTKAAPGFDEYLKTYSELSKPISAQRYLQGLDLTDTTGASIQLGKVKSQINRIEKLRKEAGSNDAKAITAEQLEGLRNLQRDLVRESNSSLKGKSAGSNTAQNLAMDNLMQSSLPGILGRLPLAPEGIGGALGYALGGPVGSGIGAAGGNALRQAMAAQNPAIEARLIDLLTDPTTKLMRSNGGPGNSLLQRLSAPASISVTSQRSNQN